VRRVHRRAVIAGAVGSLFASSGSIRQPGAQAAATSSLLPRRPLDFRPFGEALSRITPDVRCRLDAFIAEATVATLQADLDAGRFGAVDLVAYYIDRIRRLDAVQLRSVIELNPEALDIASERDAERAAGRTRGLLHGLPVLLKDNIGTGDLLHTTAGAAALSSARCDRDAHLVKGLRDAGAIILGKTNLSEWAYWMSYVAPSGFSAVGGQVVCPYGEGIDPFGSSTGSAVAATMNLAAVTVGTETMGSIVSPSARASVVGMRPSLGLVSQDRVLPISDECDTAGPIGRTVTDVAATLTAMAATTDPRDRHASRAEGLHGTDFLATLDRDALRGKRVGVLGAESSSAGSDEWIIGSTGLSDAVAAMEAAGARIVALRPAPFELEGAGFVPEFNWGLREGVNAYLSATDAPVRTLADVIAFNDENPGRYAPWGQDRLRDCLWSPLGETEVRQIARANRQQARAYLKGLFDGEAVDVLAGVDSLQSMIYPFAGFPAITVPAGVAWGTPFAVTFIGRPREDADLLSMAYAYEQASHFRTPPPLPMAAEVCGWRGGGARAGRSSWAWGLAED
jgi:amidase